MKTCINLVFLACFALFAASCAQSSQEIVDTDVDAVETGEQSDDAEPPIEETTEEAGEQTADADEESKPEEEEDKADDAPESPELPGDADEEPFFADGDEDLFPDGEDRLEREEYGSCEGYEREWECADDDCQVAGVSFIPNPIIFLLPEQAGSFLYEEVRILNHGPGDAIISGISLAPGLDEHFWLDKLPDTPFTLKAWYEEKFLLFTDRANPNIYKGELLIQMQDPCRVAALPIYVMTEEQSYCKSYLTAAGKERKDPGELREGWKYRLPLNLYAEGFDGSSMLITYIKTTGRNRNLDYPYYQADYIVSFNQYTNFSYGPFDAGDSVSDWAYIDYSLDEEGDFFVNIELTATLTPSQALCYDRLEPQTNYYESYFELFVPSIYEIDPNPDYVPSGEYSIADARLPWDGVTIEPCSQETGTTKLKNDSSLVWSNGAGQTVFGGKEELWIFDESGQTPTLKCYAGQPGPMGALTGRGEGAGLEVWGGFDGAIGKFAAEAWETVNLPSEMLSDSAEAGVNIAADLNFINGYLIVLTNKTLGALKSDSTWKKLEAPDNLDREYGLHPRNGYLYGAAGTSLYKIDETGAYDDGDLCFKDLEYHFAELKSAGEVLETKPRKCRLGALAVIGSDEKGLWIAEKKGKPVVWLYLEEAPWYKLIRVVAPNGGGYKPPFNYELRGGMGGEPMTALLGGNRLGGNVPGCEPNPMSMGNPCTSQNKLAVLSTNSNASTISEPYYEKSFCDYSGMCMYGSSPSVGKGRVWRGSGHMWLPWNATKITWTQTK